MQLTDDIVNKLLEPYLYIGGFPFLKHLDYFKKDNIITACSIGDRWSELSGENGLKTYVKGQVTIRGANHNNPEYQDGSCPWKHIWGSQDMMCVLKHPCDTGIVNKDGSINIEILKDFIKRNFEWDQDINTFIMRESTIIEYLKICKQRDIDLNLNIKPSMFGPSFATVAVFEWDDFYYNYCDRIINKERAVTVGTLLQFYFEADVLYQRTLNGELPVKK